MNTQTLTPQNPRIISKVRSLGAATALSLLTLAAWSMPLYARDWIELTDKLRDSIPAPYNARPQESVVYTGCMLN